MRVGFDGTLHGARTTGAGEYQRQLLLNLSRVDADLELVLYRARAASHTPSESAAEVHDMPWRADQRLRRILGGAVSWRRRFLRDSLDLLHVPFYYLPPGAPHKSIVTIYDTRFLRFPETYPRARAAFLRAMVPRSLRRARLVVTISEFSKREIVELVGIDPQQIRVTPLAARSAFAPVVCEETRVAVAAKYKVPSRFILSTSTLEPRKNLARVIEAFAQLRGSGIEEHLVLAGVKYFGDGDIMAAIARHGLAECVHIIGYVDDEHMAALYSMASVFIYPSLYEGFGIPPLESMACGTPVVAANGTSIPEVVGDAAVLVDPYDVQDIARGLRHVLGDPLFARKLSERGLAHSKSFSWTTTAELTVNAYRWVHESS